MDTKSSLCSSSCDPAACGCEKAVEDGLGIRVAASCWETMVEFLAPDIGLAQAPFDVSFVVSPGTLCNLAFKEVSKKKNFFFSDVIQIFFTAIGTTKENCVMLQKKPVVH